MEPQSRAGVLEAVRAGQRTVADVSAAIGLHPNTVRTQLKHLVDEGLLVRQPASPSGRGRPRSEYYPAAGMHGHHADKPVAQVFDDASVDLVVAGFGRLDVPDAEDVTARARRLASRLPPMATDTPDASTSLADLAHILTLLRFDPSVEANRITLRGCPILRVAEPLPHVGCSLHAEVIRARLENTGSPWTARLRPFAIDGRCVVDLSAPGATDEPG